ncbi:hypothetical protein FGO68_gene15009 [Halteria grandinella]|uniref:Uncharacterized protein n=1 Tax=Halteria grandinella TaxID=5974 RepID=A0A8J8NGK1_HALGN|nr:hypothetical protein FGO68_gene15009 [Halteria grandinella]
MTVFIFYSIQLIQIIEASFNKFFYSELSPYLPFNFYGIQLIVSLCQIRVDNLLTLMQTNFFAQFFTNIIFTTKKSELYIF